MIFENNFHKIFTSGTLMDTIMLTSKVPHVQSLLVKSAAGFGYPMTISKSDSLSSQLCFFPVTIGKRQISCDVMFMVSISVHYCTHGR
jgi:hypothetical protein